MARRMSMQLAGNFMGFSPCNRPVGKVYNEGRRPHLAVPSESSVGYEQAHIGEAGQIGLLQPEQSEQRVVEGPQIINTYRCL
jgi:hypothetical protein